jgi:hypothetical protein
VANLVVRGMDLRTEESDERPAIVLDDVTGARFSAVQPSSTTGVSTWSLAGVTGLHARDASGLPDGDVPTSR